MATIVGTSGRDILRGTLFNDTIRGLGGNDSINGSAGNDQLIGGAGDDSIVGASGNDRILGGAGHDILFGSAGNDMIYGGPGSDRIEGGAGDDVIDTSSPNSNTGDLVEVADGGDGNDFIRLVGGRRARALGGDGDDTIVMLGGSADGGAGNDQISGRSSGNISGGAGNDTINASVRLGGFIRGDAGNDVIVSGTLGATLDGGDGNDELTATGNAINLIGGLGNDTLRGSDSGRTRMSGGAGADVLIGGSADDSMDGGSGRDTLSGGGGDDIVDGGGGRDRLIWSMTDNVGTTDTYVGGSGRDVLEIIIDRSLDVDFLDSVRRWEAQIAAGNYGPFTIGGTVGENGYQTVLNVNQIEEVVVTFLGPDNTPPSVVPLVRNIGEDGPALGVNLLNGASDPDAGQTLSVTGVPSTITTDDGRSLQRGTDYTVSGSIFSITAAGFAEFNSLAAGEGDRIVVSFGVSDGIASVANTLTVSVAGANDAAAISGDTSGQVTEDVQANTNGALQVADPDAGESAVAPLTGVPGAFGVFSITSGGQWGYALDNANAAVQALDTGEQLEDSFVVTSIDGTASETVTITILGQDDAAPNEPPTAVNDGYDAREGLTAIVGAAAGVLANDDDPDDDPLTAVLVDDADNGELTLNPDGSFSYTPNPGFSGEDSFTYRADDGVAQSAPATVTIDVAPVFPSITFGGIAANEELGYSVSAAGDVDNDGLADILIGAPLGDIPGADNVGETYLVWGAAIQASPDGSVDLATLSATGSGIVLQGINFTDESGFSVSDAGDVDNDGFDDILIGAPNADPPGNPQGGETYLLWGSALSSDADGFIDLAGITLNGSGVRFDGQSAMGGQDQSGYSVSGAGDVDGDGLDDVLIGAPFANLDQSGNFNNGKTYLVWGATIANDADGIIDLGAVGSAGVGVQLNGIDPDDRSGFSVQTAGDVDNDGLDDILIGVPLANRLGANSQNEGETFLIWGSALEADPDGQIDLGTVVADGTGVRIDGIYENGANSGHAVSTAGDIDGDGLGDILVGARNINQAGGLNAGETSLVWGAALVAAADNVVDLDTLMQDGAGIAIRGIGQNDFSGISVSNAGDVDNDGVDDILIGASRADSSSDADTGAAYLLWGSKIAANPADAIDLASIDATGIGVTIGGEESGDDAGFSVSAAGDVNGDGFADLLVGAPSADPDGLSDAGKAYLISGITLVDTLLV